MANFGQLILTSVGLQEQYKAQSGARLKFTRIGMGSGKFSGNIMALTDLVTENVSVDITKGYVQNNAFTVEGFFSNEGLTTGFAWREIGVFVEDQSGKEVLYCYANAGDTYDFIPATADERYTKYIRVAIAIGNAANVTIAENQGLIYVDTMTFNTAVEELRTNVDQLWPSKGKTGSAIFIDDSAKQPFVGMHLYGKSTQDGIPTPDSPKEIKSLAVDGALNVNVHGAQLFDKSEYVAGYGIGKTSGAVYVDTNVFSTGYIYVNGLDSISWNGVSSSDGGVWGAWYDSEKTYLDGLSARNNADVPADACFVRLTFLNEYLETLMINAGYESLDFEAYTEQIVTVATPNGLMGIPVLSGGNYTDANGQQWVCDEVDLARGVYVQRIKKMAFNGANGFGYNTHSNGQVYVSFSPNDIMKASPLLSNRYEPVEWSNKDGKAYCSNTTIVITDNRFTSGSIASSILADEEPVFLYILATPIETALTSEQISAYKALTANNPRTTILNDAGAEMKVQYITKTFDDVLAAARTMRGDINMNGNSLLDVKTIVLTEDSYGTELPASGVKGQLFFLKV